MRRYARDLKDIADLYNIKSDSDTSKKGEGLKILTDKQMLNRLPILLAQIEAGNNSIKLKNEARQILYSLYRSKVVVYNGPFWATLSRLISRLKISRMTIKYFFIYFLFQFFFYTHA